MAIEPPVQVGATVPGIIDPYRVTTWPEEAQRNHRLRRALHELMADPGYRLEVGTRPDGETGIRIVPAEIVTSEARAFLTQYREELITHVFWLREIDQEAGITEDVPPWKRAA